MKSKLLIGILGKSKSGKSHTWDILFGHAVKTGKYPRRLFFNETEYTNIFLLSRSPQERKLEVASIIKNDTTPVVLCSMQYQKGVKQTIDYFYKKNFYLYIQCLDPGFMDGHDKPLFYDTTVINQLFENESLISIRNGKLPAKERVEEIKDFIYGWAKTRNLIKVKRIYHRKSQEII